MSESLMMPATLAAQALEALDTQRWRTETEAVLAEVREQVDAIHARLQQLPDSAIEPLGAVLQTINQLEVHLPEKESGLSVARLQLTQQLVMLGHLLVREALQKERR